MTVIEKTTEGNTVIMDGLATLGLEVELCGDLGPRNDHWPRNFKGDRDARAAVVCYPRDAKAVSDVFRFAVTYNLRVAPYGLGSSVVGCFEGEPDIFCSTERMCEVEEFNPTNCCITVGAGMNGGDLQQYLLKRGFELGQAPQSLYMSTIGGWVNTRATGGLSTFFGGIEDVVTGLEAVLPNGEIVNIASSPRPSGGLDLVQTLIGTEGSLAIVTKVSLAVFRQLPTVQLAAGFESFDQAIEAQRQLVQGGFPVALLRSYNIAETAHVSPSDEPYSLLNFSLIAPGRALDVMQAAAERVVETCGGWLLHEDAASKWYMGRYQVETMMEDRNSEPGKMFDTVELSLPWDSAAACCTVLEEKTGGKTTEFFAHFSHAYQTGACLYAIFWTEGKDDDDVVEKWAGIWDEVIQIVADHGGTLSHHHGIGSMRSKRYQDSSQGKVHQAIKSVLDPHNTLFARLVEKA